MINFFAPLRRTSRKRGPWIFGIGLSRTGTSSLHEALGLLGLRSAHYLPDEGVAAYLRDSTPFELRQWLDYEAVSDTPVCSLYSELDAACPGSRFILTTRPLESWLASCRRHWARQNVFQSLHRPLASARIWSPWQTLTRQRVYGTQDYDEAAFAAVFAAHHEAVRRYFAGRAQDLLVLDLSQPLEWEPLCAFLGKPIPQAPFPWANRHVYAAKHAGTPRLRHAVHQTYPAGNLHHVVVPYGSQTQDATLLSSEQTQALVRCSHFKDPARSPELANLARSFDPHRPAPEVWADLRHRGLLAEESAWLPPPAGEAAPALRYAAIPTSGRGLAALNVARELARHAATAGQHATITLANLDRNTDAEALRAAAASSGLDLRWTGASQVESFLRILEQEGFPRPVVDFLFTGGVASYSCGAVRNCLLAAHVGSPFLFQDDDVHGPLTDIRRSEEPCALAGAPLDHVFRIFPSLEAAERMGLPDTSTPWNHHQSLLGRLASDLGGPEGGLQIDLGQADDPLLALLHRPDARVRATFLGFRGDAGTAEGSCRWGFASPIASHWLANPEIYAATRFSRAFVMGSAQHRLDQRGFHFISTALDARGMLPPFLPQGRGSDMLFIRSLCLVEPSALCGHLPWTLHHLPVHPRPDFLPVDHPATVFPWIESQMLLQDAARESTAPGPMTLARLAAGTASLDADGLRDWMTTRLRLRAGRWLQRLETLRAEASPCPDATADLECLLRRGEEFFIHAPVLWPADLGPPETAGPAFQRLLTKWAEALALWPDLWQALLHHPEWIEVLAPPAARTQQAP